MATKPSWLHQTTEHCVLRHNKSSLYKNCAVLSPITLTIARNNGIGTCNAVNKKLRDAYAEQLHRHEQNIDLCNAVMEMLKPMITFLKVVHQSVDVTLDLRLLLDTNNLHILYKCA